MLHQLFLFDDETLRSISREEVEATYADMIELDIAKPPYEDFAIGITLLARGNWARGRFGYDNDTVEDFPLHIQRAVNRSPVYYHFKNKECILHEIVAPKGYHFDKKPAKPPESVKILANELLMILIVLLATRNVEKQVAHSQMTRLGIGKRRAEYTTTIKLGNVVRTAGNHNQGCRGTVRPHLRRGHIRVQPYGPNNCFLKKIFIQPCFVNADENFINARTSYNLSNATPPSSTQVDLRKLGLI